MLNPKFPFTELNTYKLIKEAKDQGYSDSDIEFLLRLAVSLQISVGLSGAFEDMERKLLEQFQLAKHFSSFPRSSVGTHI